MKNKIKQDQDQSRAQRNNGLLIITIIITIVTTAFYDLAHLLLCMMQLFVEQNIDFGVTTCNL